MSDDNKKDGPKVQADNNSIAVGGISAGGSIGDVNIKTGYTADQVSILIAQIQSTFQPKPFDGRCPYKGLYVFEEEDAELFFGREKLVDDLVNRVKDSRTVFVTGPSGSGKSSLVRAGLIHALKQGDIKGSDRWLYATMKPGRDPIGELGRVVSSLASSTNPEDEIRAKAMKDAAIFARWCEIALKEGRDKRLVLFIDQFEEVFTQISKEEERVAFLNLLTHAATIENGRVIILFSMRSDFVSNCATYPQLNALLNQQFVQIGAMQTEELVSAIAQPALRVGLRIDPDLIAQIINEMKGEPGALPLMQFALKDLFDSQQEKSGVIALTLNDYLQRGGIHKALERHADDSFSKLSKNEQELARSIFSGLIEIGRGTQDTKRTALFDELVPANTKAEDVEAIVRKLADARLVTTEEGSEKYTITHEKLIDAWPWLKKLVNDNRDVIALQNEISGDAKEWDEHQRDDSYLYSGARLGFAQEQLVEQKIMLNGLAKDFIEEGINAKNTERKSKELLRKRITLGLVAGMTVALVLAGFAIYQMVQVQNQAKIALTRQLAAQAKQLFEDDNSDREKAILLAIQSVKTSPNSEAGQVLQHNTLARPMLDGLAMFSATFSPKNDLVAFEGCSNWTTNNNCSEGVIRIWDIAKEKEITRLIRGLFVTSTGFSPDGKYIVSGGCDIVDKNYVCTQSSARIWEVATGKEISHREHNSYIYSVAFSPDGKHVVSSSWDGIVLVWDAETGSEVARMLLPDSSIMSTALSADGKYIASGGWELDSNTNFGAHGYIRIWEANTGKEITRIAHGAYVYTVAFSPDSKYIVSGGCDQYDTSRYCIQGSARVWETETGKEITRTSYQSFVSSVAFSPDSKYVVSASDDNTAHVWNATSGEEITHVKHGSFFYSVAFSPDGKYIVSGGCDQVNIDNICDKASARVWESDTGKEIKYIPQNSYVDSITFSPNGEYVVLASCEVSTDGQYCVRGSIHMWQTETEEHSFMKHGSFVYSVAFSSDGKHVVSGGCDKVNIDNVCTQGSARVWEAETGKEITRMTYGSYVWSVAFSPDEKYVVSGGCDKVNIDNVCTQGSARVWESETGKEITSMIYGSEVSSVAFSPDGKYVVSGGCDQVNINYVCTQGSARVWESETGKEITSMVYGSGVSSVAFSPDGKYVASGGCDQVNIDNLCTQGSIHLWDFEKKQEIASMTPGSDVMSIVFSPNSKYLASGGCGYFDIINGCTQGFVRIWVVETGKEISLMTHEKLVNYIVFSPEGEFVASASDDNTARVWDLETGREIIRMIQDSFVNSIAFSPDGKYVSSGGCDHLVSAYYCDQGSVQVWELATGKEIARMAHDSYVNSVVFSPNGESILSGGGTIARTWVYRPEDLIAETCSRLTRNLTRAEWNQYIGDSLPYQAVCPNLPIEAEITPTPISTSTP